MAEQKIAETNTSEIMTLSSMATGLEKLIGHRLSSEEIELYQKKLSGIVSTSENLEDLFTNYMELVNAWSVAAHGPAITDLAQHIQAALRGFIPTGDGVVDENLGLLIGKLIGIEQANIDRLTATPEQWQVFHNVLKESQSMVEAISQAPKVNDKALEAARSRIVDAIMILNPIRAETNLSSLTVRIESSEDSKPAPF